jgi:hypothetical protein
MLRVNAAWFQLLSIKSLSLAADARPAQNSSVLGRHTLRTNLKLSSLQWIGLLGLHDGDSPRIALAMFAQEPLKKNGQEAKGKTAGFSLFPPFAPV